MHLIHRLRAWAADQDGATALEYGLIIALIFLVIVTSVTAFATSAGTMFGTINTAIGGAL